MKLNLEGQLFKIKMLYSAKRPSGNMWSLVVNVNIEDIIYIENYNRQTIVYTEDGEYIISAPFGTVKKILEQDDRFKYSHCSYMVNVLKVHSIGNDMIKITTKNKKYDIPLTKRRKREFYDAYEKYNG